MSSLNSLLFIFNYIRKYISCSNNTKLENPGPALPHYYLFCFFICVPLFYLRFTFFIFAVLFYLRFAFLCVLPFCLCFQLYFSQFSFLNLCFLFLYVFSFFNLCFLFYLCLTLLGHRAHSPTTYKHKSNADRNDNQCFKANLFFVFL